MGRFRDIDRGYKKLVTRVFGIGRPVVQVGIFAADGGEDYGNGTTVLEVAVWNEFGTENIPERSFLRAWFDENQDKCRKATAAMLKAVIEGKYSKDQALQLLAQRFVGEIQRRMAAGIPPPNAPSTVARKGSATPLIDTGQLRSSISYSIDGKQQDSKNLAKGKKRRAKQKARQRKKDRTALKRKGIRVLKSARSVAKKIGKGIFRRGRKVLSGKKSRAPKAKPTP